MPINLPNLPRDVKPGNEFLLDDGAMQLKVLERSGEGAGDHRMMHELLNFSDGQRNLLEIRDAVSAEYREVEAEDVRKLFDALEERQMVRY